MFEDKLIKGALLDSSMSKSNTITDMAKETTI